MIGVILQKNVLISAQIALLAGLVIISDLIAFVLVATMAFGNKRVNGGNQPLSFDTIRPNLTIKVNFLKKND